MVGLDISNERGCIFMGSKYEGTAEGGIENMTIYIRKPLEKTIPNQRLNRGSSLAIKDQ